MIAEQTMFALSLGTNSLANNAISSATTISRQNITNATLREAYVREVRALEDIGLNARAAGATGEATARMLSQMRRNLGIQYKNLTPPNELAKIYARNAKKYGDPLGPSIDYLRRVEGKSWEQIIDKASRPGGIDLGY